MQTQTDTRVAEPRNSLGDVLRRTYARNHESMEDFPVFAEQFQKVQSYIAKNPLDVEKRVYYAHLLSEIGAAPQIMEQIVGLSLAAEPPSPFLLYSLKVALKKVGKKEEAGKYDLLMGSEVLALERPFIMPGESMVVPLPRKWWWPWQRYEVAMAPSYQARECTFGELEFLTAQLNEQTW